MQNSCQIFDFLKQGVKMGLVSGGEWSVEARSHKSRVKGQQKANPSQFSHTKISGFTTATKVAFRIFVGAHATLTKTRCFGPLGSQKNLLLYIIFCILYFVFVFAFLDQVSFFSLYIYHELWALGPSVFYLGPPSLSLSLYLYL